METVFFYIYVVQPVLSQHIGEEGELLCKMKQAFIYKARRKYKFRTVEMSYIFEYGNYRKSNNKGYSRFMLSFSQ